MGGGGGIFFKAGLMTDAVLTRSSLRSAPRRRSPFMRKAFPYLLVAPAVIYLLAITLYPGIFALWRSFYAGRFQLNFVGFEQYIDLFQDERLLAQPVQHADHRRDDAHHRIRHRAGARRTGLPRSAGEGLAHHLPAADAVHALGRRLPVEAAVQRRPRHQRSSDARRDHRFATSTSWAPPGLARSVLIVTDVWQWTPFLFIIFVAALQGQDKEIEEAARLDGARWRQVFFSISLPMMRPVIAIALVLRGIDILTMFASPHIITQGAPAGDTETVSYFIYRTGFKSFEFGYASAASVIVLILTIILAQIFVRRFFNSGRD